MNWLHSAVRVLVASGGIFAGLLGVSIAVATVIGDEDGRGLLITQGPKLGLSQKEVDRIQTTTGWVICPGTKYGNGIVGTGFLYRTNRILVTAAHALVDDDGRLREPLGDCYFLKYVKDVKNIKKYRFDVRPNSIYLAAREQNTAFRPNDIAVIRLMQPVEDAEPYTKVSAGHDVIGSEILVVTAVDRVNNTDAEPNVQKCQVRAREVRKFFLTDCDADKGDSGGPALLKPEGSSEYEMLLGIVVATSKVKHKNEPFDIKANQFTSIAPVNTILYAAKLMAEGKDLPADNAYVPK